MQRGIFAEQLLQTWPACESLLLVDVWAPLDNYVDVANVPQREQDAIMREALERTAFWRHKLSVCRNLTTLCAAGVRDGDLIATGAGTFRYLKGERSDGVLDFADRKAAD